MTALPADVARALQGARRCRCGVLFHTTDPDERLCNDCAADELNRAPIGSIRRSRQQPRLRPRGLGEY